MTESNRPLLITIWEWMHSPTRDNYNFGHKIVEEIINCGGIRAVLPYKPTEHSRCVIS